MARWLLPFFLLLFTGLFANSTHNDPDNLHANDSCQRCSGISEYGQSKRHWKRYTDSTFRGNPKTREEVWHQNFNTDSQLFDQTPSLILLINKIITNYLHNCIPVILYDNAVQNSETDILQKLFQTLPASFMHGQVNDKYEIMDPHLIQSPDSKCLHYVLFIADAMQTRKVIGPQLHSRVIVVPRSTQWKLQEFLSSPLSRDIINLLVIGESYGASAFKERPFVLYTHNLYVDGLGTNEPSVLTSWVKGKLTRPHVNLFPKKFKHGFSGHRFVVAAANQPPFVFKMKSTDSVGTVNIRWEGIELRMLMVMQKFLNFTIDITESRNGSLGSGDQVIREVGQRRADIGVAGCYITTDRLELVEMSVGHTRDCASFLTLASKALPRYRAIFGPFQYTVWIALTATYLLAIFPLAFSDKLTLRHLIGNASEVENMFWYVFGTFTNCFTFVGKNSWSSSKRNSTRMLIGWYWVFTIIITSCYTGSIIAFVTLPVFPSTVNTISELLAGFFRVGTLDHGGWQYWFQNSSHALTAKLLKDLEYVANMDEGLNNVTKAFFWPYAFLASKAEIEYIVTNNISALAVSKRSALHISDKCFGLFFTGFAVPHESVYTDSFNNVILIMQQAGLMSKFADEVAGRMRQLGGGRLLDSSSSKSLAQTSAEERGLTLADTEGMFLLLGVGFLVSGGVLISEWVGGCSQKCRSILSKRRDDQQRAQAAEDTATDAAVAAAAAASTSRRRRSTTTLQKAIENVIAADAVERVSVSGKEEGDAGKSQKSLSSADSRKTSASLNIFNRQTLMDMSEGHKRRHSNVIVMDGDLITEADALSNISHKYELLEQQSNASSVNNSQTIDVEINRQE